MAYPQIAQMGADSRKVSAGCSPVRHIPLNRQSHAFTLRVSSREPNEGAHGLLFIRLSASPNLFQLRFIGATHLGRAAYWRDSR